MSKIENKKSKMENQSELVYAGIVIHVATRES